MIQQKLTQAALTATNKIDNTVYAVLDTNIILSALLFNHSNLSQIRNLWQQQKFVPLASKATISELMRVLAYPKFKLTPIEQQDLMAEYLPYVKTASKIKALDIICRDANDVMLLQLATAGQADYLVTGDQDLIVLAQQVQFKIITLAEFMAIYPGT